jgi:UDP:flavonoid glycosyltransferase YjiC (YdhE family)
MNQNKTILVCPLNWGLGHATRDIPIIRRLQLMGYKVIVATESPLKELLKEAVPGLIFEDFPGPVITYSKSNLLIIKLLRQLPFWIKWLKKEQAIIYKLVQKHQPRIILSDNRYGARHPKVRSIIITHQLMIKLPSGLKWAEPLVHRLILNLVNRFDECWIPDFEKGRSLAGDLAHLYPLPTNAHLIGPLSRFMDTPLPKSSPDPHYECLAVLSGPEPQKSQLKSLLVQKLKQCAFKSLIITGEPNLQQENNVYKTNVVNLLPHLNEEKLAQLIVSTPTFIARSGYTTIMDLYYLNKNALLVPTPGQSEQSYLANYHARQHQYITQKNIPGMQLNVNTRSVAFRNTLLQGQNHLLQPVLNRLNT